MDNENKKDVQLFDVLVALKDWIETGDRDAFLSKVDELVWSASSVNDNDAVNGWLEYIKGLATLLKSGGDPYHAFQYFQQAASYGHIAAQVDAVSFELFLRSGEVSIEKMTDYLTNILYSEYAPLCHIGNLSYVKGAAEWRHQFPESLIEDYMEKAPKQSEHAPEIIFNDNQVMRLEAVSNREIERLINAIQEAVEACSVAPKGNDAIEWRSVKTVSFGSRTWINVVAINDTISLDLVDWKSSSQLCHWRFDDPEIADAISVLMAAAKMSRNPLVAAMIEKVISGVEQGSVKKQTSKRTWYGAKKAG